MKKYLSLVKFAHTIFALPFALVGLLLGIQTMMTTGQEPENPYWLTAILVVFCMVFARNAAMAFNRLVDRSYDADNERTANREIPSGQISAQKAQLFIGVNVTLFILTTYFINIVCLALSPVALAVILGYSYTKRFTALCHLVLGLGLALAPIGAYLAVTGVFAWAPVVLGIAVLTWVSGFDVMYALQDEQFDQAHNLHSIPTMLGRSRALAVSIALHVLSGSMIILFGWLIGGGLIFWLGGGVFLGLLMYQHLIVSANDLSRINLAFFTTNGIASVLFSLFAMSEIWFVGVG